MQLRRLALLSCLLLALSAAGCQASAPQTVSANTQPTATLTDAQEEQTPAWAQVVSALNQWNKANADAAVDQIIKVQALEKNDSAFFLHAGDMLANANAWPLAAVMYLNLKRIQPQNLPVDQLNKIHAAAYLCGADAQAGRVFMVDSDPWLDLGRVRFELRNGQQAVAASDIQSVTSDAELLAQFPEALLVETEVFIVQQQWSQANADLDKLLTFPNLPDWITKEVSRLRTQAQPPKS